MRKSIFLLGGMGILAACGQSTSESSANAVEKSSAVEKPRPAYCFFKNAETKGWKASRDKQGNIVVHGKAYRQDTRYKAALAPATVSGAKAVVSPTIVQNDTGFGARDDWWDVTATIPNSAAIDAVDVQCGNKTLASLTVSRKK